MSKWRIFPCKLERVTVVDVEGPTVLKEQHVESDDSTSEAHIVNSNTICRWNHAKAVEIVTGWGNTGVQLVYRNGGGSVYVLDLKYKDKHGMPGHVQLCFVEQF